MLNRRLHLILATLCALSLVTVFAVQGLSQAKPKQDPIILKGSPLGGVKFEHEKHVERSNKNCQTCHHAAKPEKAPATPYQACQSCHTNPAKPPMKTPAVGAFHKNLAAQAGVCIDCHKAENAKGKKSPVTCPTCHMKANT
jgi:hypothetical protein